MLASGKAFLSYKQPIEWKLNQKWWALTAYSAIFEIVGSFFIVSKTIQTKSFYKAKQ